MNLLKKVSLVLALTALTVAMALAQQSVTRTGTDGSGSGSVTIGIDPSATSGIDAALGEYGLPPLPPTFDIRCVTKTGWDNLGTDGTRLNFHQQLRTSQTDRYRIAFKPEVGGATVTISWPAGMGSLYGGYWMLLDGTGAPLCDMTQQTSYAFLTEDDSQIFFEVLKGDALGYLTAQPSDLINAKDSKGKGGKAEKRKNYASEGEFTFTNAAVDSNNKLYVEFSQAVTIVELAPFDVSSNPDGKKKKWIFSFSNPAQLLGNGAVVTMFVTGDKGKDLVAKKYWWIPAVPPLKWKGVAAGPVTPVVGTSRLWVKMPNWNNVGEETYLKTGPPWGQALGLWLGIPASVGKDLKGKDIFKYIYHPKWKDVVKTLGVGKTQYGTGGAVCLDMFNSKPIVKPYKALAAEKATQPNELIPNLLALKFNIGVSQAEVCGNPYFGDLIYVADPEDAPWADGLTVSAIAAKADSFLSCTTTYTGMEIVSVMKKINASFAGTFDTLRFGAGTIVKPGNVLANVTQLYRPSLAPVAPKQEYFYAETTPVEFRLNQNYPNPFNPTTTISFDLMADAFVTLKVYNTLGQEVATLIDNEEFTEGSNDVQFDASTLSSGVYYYRLVVNDGELQQVQKMMLLK